MTSLTDTPRATTEPEQPPTGKAPRQPRPARSGRDAWLLLVPALIPIALFSVYPLVQGIYLGFTDSRAGLDQVTHFTGLANFRDLMSNHLFWNSFKIGLIWAFSVTVLQFVAAMGLALLLHQDLRMRWLARTLSLVPWAMPPVVVAVLWRLLLDPNAGPISGAWQGLGFGQLNLLGNFHTALPTVIVVGVWWGMPQTTITLLAGLQGVDDSLYEAAAVDAAGPWRRFVHITLPQLRPVIVAITSLNFIWNINSFDLIYVMTNGGPGGRTMVPALFAYNEAFRYGHFGAAAAMGNVMVLIIVVMLLVYLRARLKGADQ